MAKKKKQEETEIVDVSGAEKFIENNVQKLLIGLLAIVAVAAVFIFLLQSGKGKEKKAVEAAIEAQDAFAAENWNLAIEGSDTQVGFQEIADSYGNTKIGNLAHYYLGTAYMKNNKFEEAIAEFKEYKETKDPNINGLAYMNLGDAQSELDQLNDAVNSYKKAANMKSEAFQPDFIFRYAMAQVKVEDFDGAKKSLNRIITEFPNNALAADAENYLAGL